MIHAAASHRSDRHRFGIQKHHHDPFGLEIWDVNFPWFTAFLIEAVFDNFLKIEIQRESQALTLPGIYLFPMEGGKLVTAVIEFEGATARSALELFTTSIFHAVDSTIGVDKSNNGSEITLVGIGTTKG